MDHQSERIIKLETDIQAYRELTMRQSRELNEARTRAVHFEELCRRTADRARISFTELTNLYKNAFQRAIKVVREKGHGCKDCDLRALEEAIAQLEPASLSDVRAPS